MSFSFFYTVGRKNCSEFFYFIWSAKINTVYLSNFSLQKWMDIYGKQDLNYMMCFWLYRSGQPTKLPFAHAKQLVRRFYAWVLCIDYLVKIYEEYLNALFTYWKKTNKKKQILLNNFLPDDMYFVTILCLMYRVKQRA